MAVAVAVRTRGRGRVPRLVVIVPSQLVHLHVILQERHPLGMGRLGEARAVRAHRLAIRLVLHPRRRRAAVVVERPPVRMRQRMGNGGTGGGRGRIGVSGAAVEGGGRRRGTGAQGCRASARPGVRFARLADEARWEEWGCGGRGTWGTRGDAGRGERRRELGIRVLGDGNGARARGPRADPDGAAHARTLTAAFGDGAEGSSFVDAIDAYAFSPATLPLTLDPAPHLFGDAKALAAASLVARTRIRSGKRLVADGTWGGLATVACGLVEMAREVARGTELEVALCALVLGIGLRVLHDHPARLFL